VWGILVSDIHLQARPPVARSTEPDWWAAMARPLIEIQDLVKKYECPVLYAGDIFNRWDPRPEVINFALKYLPKGFAIPGQHDLPNHNYDEIRRSAYWTLVEAGHLINLPPGTPFAIGNLMIWAYPWGQLPTPLKPRDRDGKLRVALTHQFIWTENTGYPGAPTIERVSAHRHRLTGYDVGVFGDNHKGFTHLFGPTGDGPCVFNCGGLMRRKVDEEYYRPGVGLLHIDGRVTRHYLDISEDQFIHHTEAEETVKELLGMTDFVSELQDLEASDALNFTVAIKRFLKDNKVAKRVTEIILQSCEGD